LTSIATVVVAVTIIPLCGQLKLAKNVATSDFIAEMDEEFNSSRMLKIRKEAALSFKESGDISGCEDVLDFFEKIAYEEKIGVISLDAVDAMWGYWIEHYWQLSKSYIKNFRAKRNNSSYYASVEDLYKRLILRASKEAKITTNEYTERMKHDLEDFKQGESQLSIVNEK